MRRARNLYSQWRLWIPGSLVSLAPRNDDGTVVAGSPPERSDMRNRTNGDEYLWSAPGFRCTHRATLAEHVGWVQPFAKLSIYALSSFRGAANAASPESITTVGGIDSGQSLRDFRNDGVR